MHIIIYIFLYTLFKHFLYYYFLYTYTRGTGSAQISPGTQGGQNQITPDLESSSGHQENVCQI